MNAPPNSLAATRPATTSSFSLYTVIIGLSLLVALNPLTMRLFTNFGGLGDVYLLTLDLCLIAVVALAALHLRTRRRGYGVLAAIGVAATLPVMVVAEFTYTYLYIGFNNLWTGVKIMNVYEPDPRFGWRLIPNNVGRHINPGVFDVTYGTDAFGRRKLPKAAVTSPTVHVFGSSFTFSDGVNDDQTALYLLADANRDRIRIVDYSVSAYGLDQMVLGLETNQKDIAPGDVVVIAPTSISLTWSWVSKGKPCAFKLARGSYPIGSIPFLTPKGWQFIDIHAVCGTVETVFLNSPFLIGSIVSALDDDTKKAIIEHTDLLLAHAQKIVEARGARLLPIMIVNADECRGKRYAFDFEGLKAPIVSMMPSCATDTAALDGMSFSKDWHYTVKGNRWVAGVLGAIMSKYVPGLH